MKGLPKYDPKKIKVSKGSSEEQKRQALQKKFDEYVLDQKGIYPGEPAIRDFEGNAYRSIEDRIEGRTWDQRLAEERAGIPLASTTDHYPSYALKNPEQDAFLLQWMGALRKKLGMK